MKIKIRKKAFILTLYSLIFLASSTTGFDLYAHTTIYYYYNDILTHSYLFFDFLITPRYILLSTIFDISSRLGIPIAVIISVLTSMPVYSTLKVVTTNNKTNYNILSFFIITSIFILMLYYSGLSITILYLIAFLLTKNKFFIIGFFFHPVGIIISFLMLFFFSRENITHFAKVFTILLLYYISIGYFEILTSSPGQYFKHSIEQENLYDLLIDTFANKSQEYIAAIIITILIYLKSKNTLQIKLSTFNIKQNIAHSIFTIFLMTIVAYMSSKPNPNLIYSIVTADINNVMYLSWFDWGEKDITASFWDIFNERLKGTGGI